MSFVRSHVLAAPSEIWERLAEEAVEALAQRGIEDPTEKQVEDEIVVLQEQAADDYNDWLMP